MRHASGPLSPLSYTARNAHRLLFRGSRVSQAQRRSLRWILLGPLTVTHPDEGGEVSAGGR